MSANKVWATSYVVAASLQKSWYSILNSFPKSAPSQTNSGSSESGKVLGVSTTTPPSLIVNNPPTQNKDASTTSEQNIDLKNTNGVILDGSDRINE